MGSSCSSDWPGVQSNQIRAAATSRSQFVAEGMTTMMGGFHVSGYPDSCKFLNSVGITTIVGEAEKQLGLHHRGFPQG